MVVTAIYCIVIIYLPSIDEVNSTILREPKRCTTTEVERNITGTPEDGICSWSSCEEWCLSKGASPCSKVPHQPPTSLLRELGQALSSTLNAIFCYWRKGCCAGWPVSDGPQVYGLMREKGADMAWEVIRQLRLYTKPLSGLRAGGGVWVY
jgi:hypothetical protein